MISFDTETDLIARARLAPPPVCVSWQVDDQAPQVALVDEMRGEYAAWLDSSELLIGANVAYDTAVLAGHWPDLLPATFAKYARGEIEDIQINQKMIDIAARGEAADDNSLGALCVRYGLPALDKEGPWRLAFAALRGVPVAYWPAGALEYVLADARSPRAIWLRQRAYEVEWSAAAPEGAPLLHLAGREAYKAFCLHLIACWGLKADAGRVAVLRGRLDAYLGEAGPRLRRCGLVRKDGSRDTKKAKAYMTRYCARVGAPVRMTKPQKGRKSTQPFVPQVSLDQEACNDSGSNLLELYSHFGQAGTLLSRVEDLAAGVDLPLQVRFDTLLATSRVSTSKPGLPLVGIQAQNFPRKLLKAVAK